MEVQKIILNPFQMNCYIYYDKNSGESIIIDPAVSVEAEKKKIIEFVDKNKIKINYIINTHGHIDHVMGNNWAKETFTVPIFIHGKDIELLKSAANQGALFGITVSKQPHPDKFVSDGDIIEFNHCKIKVLHTPGHSQGSICLVDEKNKTIFSGDTIFKESIGRTDLPGGDYDLLIKSIKEKLLVYPDDFTIYPGHMEETTIGKEKKLILS